MEKDRKALFKIKKSLSLNNSCRLLEKLFDTMVLPILLYGSEVWGIESIQKNTENEPYEKFPQYAVHNSGVGFTVKKHGDSTADVRTPVNSSPVDNIRTIFGPSIANLNPSQQEKPYELLNEDGVKTNNVSDICNVFNKFFTSCVENLRTDRCMSKNHDYN
ncbi:MLH1 [Mytilus edulis]|uniref:MLH1 n=1 Tax=Mytilus edulis TaxID=6550 RepID=A0A8S3TRP9_MYTED|nr:MLH1 [Mytilus edulis]